MTRLAGIPRLLSLHGLTLGEFARKVEVGKPAVCNWIAGRSHPQYETLRVVLAVLNCSIADLERGEPVQVGELMLPPSKLKPRRQSPVPRPLSGPR